MAMLEASAADDAGDEGRTGSLDELLRRLEGTLADAVGLLAGIEEEQGRRAAAGAGGETRQEAGEEPGDEAGEDTRDLALPPGRGSAGATRAHGIERRLALVEGDRRELTTRLVDSERRGARLMTLYVATYHLHAELEPDAVLGAIAEIAVDLLGARRFALLLRDGDTCRLELARGGAEEEEIFRGGRYRGGDAMLDATLADGVLRLAPARDVQARDAQARDPQTPDAQDQESPAEEPPAHEPRAQEPLASRALAAVPLNRGDETAGVLALLDLFEQKHALTLEDRDLLDLLAAHAASALTAAELFASKERRLRTFESLVQLVKGSA